MGRKKKAAAEPPCTHCGIVFPFPLKWCPKCEDHQGDWGWNLHKDVCDRCFRGENDEYLAKKKGRAERIAKELERIKDPKNWCTCNALEAYNRWVESPEYAKRFDRKHP